MKGDAEGAAVEGPSLLDYLATIKRRRHVVLLALLVAPIAAVAASMLQTPLYRASAKVLVGQQSLAQSVAGGVDQSAVQDPQRALQTQADLAHIPAVAQRVGAATHVPLTPPRILKKCAVTANANSNLLVFSCTDEQPARARLLATSYARQYTQYRHQLDTASLLQARRDIDRQLKALDGSKSETAIALRASLLEKQQQMRVIEALQKSNVAVVQTAGEVQKTRPRPVRNAILGLFLGGILGVALTFLLDALDTRVRSTEEAERLLGLPLLARIPAPPRWLAQTGRLVMTSDPNGPHAEPFRVLRTNLDFFNIEHGARTIMITSAVEEEGKSTTVANLAVALSRAGQRVVLIDLDLRRPTLARTFGFEGTAGLTDVAQGRARLEFAETPDPNTRRERGAPAGRLDVLTAGSTAVDSGDFIESDVLPRVLRELEQHADVVLIDSPPLLRVGDALSLGAKVDAIVVLTRLGVVKRPMLKELRRALDAVPARKLGVVVTGADLDGDYPYAYGGYYRAAAPTGARP